MSSSFTANLIQQSTQGLPVIPTQKAASTTLSHHYKTSAHGVSVRRSQTQDHETEEYAERMERKKRKADKPTSIDSRHTVISAKTKFFDRRQTNSHFQSII